MANHRTSKKDATAAVKAVADYGSVLQAAKALGLGRGALEARLRTAKLLGIGVQDDAATAPLKQRVKQLESLLKAAAKQTDSMEQVKQVIGTLARQVEEFEAPEWILSEKKFKGSHGVPTLFLSDLHWGEVVKPSQIGYVNKYNLTIAHERLQRCYESAVHLLKILDPKMNYPGIVIPLGGDMISGNIHDELATTNEIDSIPAVLDLYGALVNVINAALEDFGNVFLPCVSGNHGRNTKKIWHKNRNDTSFDWMLYRFLAKRFEHDKRVQFFIPDGSDASFKIYNTRYLLTHGDKLGSGGDGLIGALGPIMRGDHKKRSRNAQVGADYDIMMCGHWHQYVHMTKVIVNGSLKGYDEFAYQLGFGFELPQQALWITHPAYGPTYRMPVYCEKKPPPKAASWVSVPEIK